METGIGIGSKQREETKRPALEKKKEGNGDSRTWPAGM